MPCACATESLLSGNAADEFARTHLVQNWVNAVAWTTGYTCPDTGTQWLRDSPQAHLHGGGPPRLRVVTSEEWNASRDST